MSQQPPARLTAGAPSQPSDGVGILRRRDLFKLAGLAAVGAGVASTPALLAGPALAAAPGAAGSPRWAGHQPGKVYLGMSVSGDPGRALSKTGPVGLFREYFHWSSRNEIGVIAGHQKAGRIPWVSFRPPSESRGAWTAITSGRYDGELRARARAYAGLAKPVIVTFNHEPQTDAKIGPPQQFADAWCHVHDVFNRETGLKNIVSVPIIGDWVFNPINKGPDPATYLTPAVLSRAHFLGIDLYQNESGETYGDRLPRVLSFLDSRGHRDMMIGIGETGCCNSYRNISGANWWRASWAWASSHSDRVGAISYFDSLAYNNSGNNWLLTESADKLAAFRASLASGISV